MSRVAATLVWWLCSGVAFAETTFPGSRSELVAPNKLVSIQWVAPKGDEDHLLVVRDMRTGQTKDLLRFPRHVEVLWSPDSARLAVSNARGSDETETLIYRVSDGSWLKVADLLREQVHRENLPAFEGAHHRYVEARRWVGSDKLEVRVWGYGGRAPFDRRFRVMVQQ